MVTQNELRFAANVPDAYVLALVEVSADGADHDRVRYLPRPYGPDVRLPFDTTSTTSGLAAVLATCRLTARSVMPTKLIEVALPLDVINAKPRERRAFGTDIRARSTSGGLAGPWRLAGRFCSPS